jgi:hypothetical protein
MNEVLHNVVQNLLNVYVTTFLYLSGNLDVAQHLQDWTKNTSDHSLHQALVVSALQLIQAHIMSAQFAHPNQLHIVKTKTFI